ncbi:MAG: hypothetical protein ABGZ53_37475 [Fuerstiella sp.]
MNARLSDNQDVFRLLQAVREVPGILKRHQKRMLCFFCGTIALVVLSLTLSPRKYVSEAKLFVRVGRQNVGLDPTATTGQTIAVHETRENEITSILDILQSRVVLQGVVDRLGADLILNGGAVQSSPDASVSSDIQSTDEQSALRYDKAIAHLNSTIETARTKNSNVLGIIYKDRSPQLAQTVLQAFVDEFQTVHINANRTVGSAAFFEKQSGLLRQQFEDASRELNEVKNSINAVSVEQRRLALQNQLNTIETTMLATAADHESTLATIRGLAEALVSLPEKTLTQEITGFPDDAIGTTRKRLYELELREQELLTRFTERHPVVMAIRRQADAARSILTDRATTGRQATNADNPAYRQVHLNQLEKQSLAVGLSAKLVALKKQHAGTQLQLRALNGKEISIVEMQQRVDLYREKFTAYSEKHEQSRIDQALETERFSNVKLVQPPTFVAKPVSPQKALTLIAGFLFASVGALALAFLSEILDTFGRHQPVMAQPSDPDSTNAQHAPENVADAITKTERLVEQVQY